jgi:hypothetical protein
VFFWPGREAGPNDHGRRHYERYRNDDVVLIRVPTQRMPEGAEVCFFNSGSPRCVDGRKSPRGSATFVRPEAPAAPALTPSRSPGLAQSRCLRVSRCPQIRQDPGLDSLHTGTGYHADESRRGSPLSRRPGQQRATAWERPGCSNLPPASGCGRPVETRSGTSFHSFPTASAARTYLAHPPTLQPR